MSAVSFCLERLEPSGVWVTIKNYPGRAEPEKIRDANRGKFRVVKEVSEDDKFTQTILP